MGDWIDLVSRLLRPRTKTIGHISCSLKLLKGGSMRDYIGDP